MGMDVYGKSPRSETGKHFRNNVWRWRPLADYVCVVAPTITAKCKYWQSNDGDGLSAKDSLALAEVLQAELDAGRTLRYERVYTSANERRPNVPCWLCDGTGTRKAIPEKGAGDPATGMKCNACDGEGTVRPNETHYPFSVENVREFVAFRKDCGGFEIW